jgi:hypothetical protein
LLNGVKSLCARLKRRKESPPDPAPPEEESSAKSFNELVRFAYDDAMSNADDAEKNAAYDAAIRDFKNANGGPKVHVAIFRNSGTGIYVTPNGVFRWTVINRALRFDWSEAQGLIYRIDAAAERARDWWAGGEPERSTALERAYGLITAVLAAVDRENKQHPEDSETEEVSARYQKNLQLVVPEIVRAEALQLNAAQRTSQARYGRGMLLGTTAIALTCGVIASIFYAYDVPAEWAVALPAGAIGALVSVLQRMTSGRLELDVDSGAQLITMYGAIRPVVGGVLGMAVFVLFEGGLLPGLEVADKAPIAFYAGVGFLAGFNERFAQDMLVGSAKRISAASSEADDPSTNLGSTGAAS